jgi:hypothetical protein
MITPRLMLTKHLTVIAFSISLAATACVRDASLGADTSSNVTPRSTEIAIDAGALRLASAGASKESTISAIPAAAPTLPVPPINVSISFCAQSSACSLGDYCAYPPGALCAGGAASRSGTCVALPMSCNADYVPVCGCDGKRYVNVCAAAQAGVSVAGTTECKASESELDAGMVHARSM